MDKILRATGYNNSVRIFLVDSTLTMRKAQQTHNLSGTASIAVGGVVNAALALQAMQKNKERIGISLTTNGPIDNIVAETTEDFNVRCFCTNPETNFINNKTNTYYTEMALGNEGIFRVIRDVNLKEPQVSSIPMIDSNIAMTTAYYFLNSEQVKSAVQTSVLVDPDTNSILKSATYLIQLLPDTDESVIDSIEKVTESNSLSSMLRKDLTQEEILKTLTEDNYKILDEIEFQFNCGCSKSMFERGLISLGAAELTSIKEDDIPCEVQCHYCNTTYTFSDEDLTELINSIE